MLSGWRAGSGCSTTRSPRCRRRRSPTGRSGPPRPRPVRGERAVTNWLAHNTAETIFDRLEQHGKTWKVYVDEPDRFSVTGLIHYPRLKHRFATHFVPFAQFEADAASGNLPDFSYIEPCLVLGHGDYHPAVSRVLGHGIVIHVWTRRPRSWAVRRSWPDLQRLQGHAVPGRGQRVEHDPADRLGRAGRHLSITSRPARCRRRTPPPRKASSGSPSTGRATASRPS